MDSKQSVGTHETYGPAGNNSMVVSYEDAVKSGDISRILFMGPRR